MKKIIARLQNVGLRQIITVFLATVTFLVVPAFNHNGLLQAQATELNTQTGEYNPVTPDTVKRIQEKAEDLGDRPEKRIGDTGLQNIKKLGENIPETIDLNIRQKRAIYSPNEPNKEEAMDKAQQKAERAANETE
jgi:hypothetical protein